jgi:hypothetical protein
MYLYVNISYISKVYVFVRMNICVGQMSGEETVGDGYMCIFSFVYLCLNVLYIIIYHVFKICIYRYVNMQLN